MLTEQERSCIDEPEPVLQSLDFKDFPLIQKTLESLNISKEKFFQQYSELEEADFKVKHGKWKEAHDKYNQAIEKELKTTKGQMYGKDLQTVTTFFLDFPVVTMTNKINENLMDGRIGHISFLSGNNRVLLSSSYAVVNMANAFENYLVDTKTRFDSFVFIGQFFVKLGFAVFVLSLIEAGSGLDYKMHSLENAKWEDKKSYVFYIRTQ